ncbi:hypothetical protein ILYODFUR_035273 [Ilyodon furcidens]|uniref:Uncharacterized protein n=1 Tax=Ilyodon furcidens TaxID=33524 RepID=A0ABV0V9C3_9TELE
MFFPEQQGKVFITCTACTLTQAGACVVSTVGNKVSMRLLCATHLHTHPHPFVHKHHQQDVFYEGKLVHTMYFLNKKTGIILLLFNNHQSQLAFQCRGQQSQTYLQGSVLTNH